MALNAVAALHSASVAAVFDSARSGQGSDGESGGNKDREFGEHVYEWQLRDGNEWAKE